ncbi:hypothetical protein OROHE_005183 [Orobanche hederae]
MATEEVVVAPAAEGEKVQSGINLFNRCSYAEIQRQCQNYKFGDEIAGKFPRFANKITMKNVSSGMKLWGVIAEVNKKDIVVSLPGGLRGLVRACDAFDPILDGVKIDMENDFLSRTYHEGQLVSCTVLQVDDDKKEISKRKIWLSLRLSLLHKSLSWDTIQEGMVLSAYVKSIEDHGYILHFGLPSFAGFMPKDNQSESRNIKVSMSQLLQGIVKRLDRTRKVVHLSSDPDMISKCVTKELKGISIDLLVPGMMVNALVQSTLENGIMFSFLTYFTGTVDVFNLDKTFPSSNWKNAYTKNMKFNARILFIDPSTRAVGLTLNPHLVNNKAPSSLVKIGDIFDQSKVVRVDKGSGLLLEIPTLPIPTPAYVNVTDVADKEAGKLDKSFKEGNLVRVRVLGYRHLEGLATGILKASALEGLIFTHSDVKPGMMVKAKVIEVYSFGAILQFASGVKALCPLRHMSEFEIAKPRKKFQAGVELVFHVLGCKSKRITVTHKKTLVKSKLPILSSYADASDGLVSHGWITKIEKHGCFVRFYNGVQGFAPRSELGLGPTGDISSLYHVEQVVKCRVVKSIPASRRINLSFNMTTTRALENESLKPGSLVAGVVEHITPHAIIVDIDASSHMNGIISLEHLADHHGLPAQLMSVMKPGYRFDELLFLDIEGNNIVLTAKYSLINSIQQLPLDISQISIHSVVHGYVCNIIETGCFVRFIGRLTGFAPKSKASDDRRSDLSEVFYVGQSVRRNIVDISTEMGRITLSLKQSLCSSTDASFIQGYFLLEEKIAKLQVLDSEDPGLRWIDEFGICSIIEGKVHEIKDYGVVVSFEEHKDVYGFISHYQLAGTIMESNSVIRAAVLDVSKIERLVDLSLKPEFINRAKKESSRSKELKKKQKRKREANEELEVNQTVNAEVEIVKENYLVLSLPSYYSTIGYASLSDYNTQKLPSKQFSHGQSVSATVMALPAPATGGRLLLLLKSLHDGVETSSSKRAKKRSSASKSDPNSLSLINVGDVIHGRIRRVDSFGLFISIDHTNVVGLCHVSELSDDHIDDLETKFKAGEKVTAKVLKVDKEKIRVSLGMKHSYFTDEEALHTPPRQNDGFRLATNDSVVYAEPTTIPQRNSMARIENTNNESDNVLQPILADVESRALVPPLDVPLDDIEGMEIDCNLGQSVENAANADKIEDKNTKRSKKKAREEREREIRAAEERLLEKDIPRNADEFEKIIRSSPNSSFIWIKYMAFMLSLADIEKARSVAERALRTINIREEFEKLNIWVAYFNLENEYGNPAEEVVRKVFQRALQYCDPKRVHLALLGMYERTEQYKLADELLDKMSRKFKHSCKVWLRKIRSLLRRNSDGIQSVVNRALLSLPRHKHIKFISRTAILEFKCGVPDRGRSMFEGMLREYPKRTDLWSIYLDQEIRLGDADLIRALFERAISLSLPPKKMKFLFNKYLEHEKSIGDEERIEAVKKAAMDYVENTLA